MIHFRVTSISRRQSSEVNTSHYTYEKDECKTQRTSGAEWEEVEFTTVDEEKPVIQVANVRGDAFLPSAPHKLIINNPKLFGTYKVGDIIEFMPTRTKPVIVETTSPSSEPPSRSEQHEGP